MPSKLDKHQVLYRFLIGCQGVGAKAERDLERNWRWKIAPTAHRRTMGERDG